MGIEVHVHEAWIGFEVFFERRNARVSKPVRDIELAEARPCL